MPRPHIYDIDRGDRALVYPWLIGNVPGGSIAYFGEMGVSPEWMGVELEKFMLESYANEYNPILGDIYLKPSDNIGINTKWNLIQQNPLHECI